MQSNKTTYERLKETRKRWNCLSADTLGSFDFCTAMVSLDSISSDDVVLMNKTLEENLKAGHKNVLSVDAYSAMMKVTPLLAHEYTHFVDSTSTLWGLRHLALLSKAYGSQNERYGAPETEFHNAKKFFDYLKTLRLPKYYTLQHERENVRPWRYAVTAGVRFSSEGTPTDRTILFCRFQNAQEEMLVRSPISTVSILEASAMAQDLYSKVQLAKALEDKDYQLVEEKVQEKQFFDYIYHPGLTEYSVCAHLVANRQGSTDAFATFALCAILCRLTMNFPLSGYMKLAQELDFSMLLGIRNHPFVERLKAGLKYGDMGVLFYLLSNALPKDAHSSTDKIMKSVDALLQNIGIDRKWLKNEITDELTVNSNALQESKLGFVRTLADAGCQNFHALDNEDPWIDFDKLQLPPVFLGDMKTVPFFESGPNKLSKIDLEIAYDEMVSGQLWMERFAEACV